MKRRVVQHGPSTLIISLPSNWIKQNNVNRGDELDIKENNKTLAITASNHVSNKSLTQNISGLEPALVKTFLARIYQKGYDKAYLVHNNINLLKKIQDKTLELIGYEIIEQNNKYCLIQSISSHIELDFDNSLRKAFVLAKQMLDTAIKAYKDNDPDALAGLSIMDLEVNRLCYFCLRQINKEQYIGTEQAQQSHILYSLIESLEHLGDNMVHLGKSLIESKKNPELIKLMQLLFEQFKLVYSYFYESTAEKANETYRIFVEIGRMVSDVSIARLSGNDLMAAYKIRAASNELYHFTISKLDFHAKAYA